MYSKNMSVSKIEKQTEWQDNDEFLQSWQYGEFLKRIGRQIEHIKISNDRGESYIQLVALTEKPGISYYYLPRAIFTDVTHVNMLCDYAKKQGKAFVRIEPSTEQGITKNTPKKYVANRQPPNTWLLDIDKSMDTLYTDMHSKTRYNIRLATRKGVTIDEEKNIELFWPIHVTTCERNHYTPHPKKYIEKLLQEKNVYQINARHEGTLLASAIVLHHQNTMYYYFGASANEKRNLMGAYLMHDYIIQKAQELHCTLYDWWGMAPRAEKGSNNADCYHNYCWDKTHPFAGVARFKVGFGGRHDAYPQAYEVPLKKMAYILYVLKHIIRKQHIVGHPK